MGFASYYEHISDKAGQVHCLQGEGLSVRESRSNSNGHPTEQLESRNFMFRSTSKLGSNSQFNGRVKLMVTKVVQKYN